VSNVHVKRGFYSIWELAVEGLNSR